MSAQLPNRDRPRVSISNMTHSDLFSVMAIEEASYEFPWSLRIFEDCLSSGYQCLVANIDDSLAGYAIESVAVQEAHILNICVRPDVRQSGIAEKILVELIDRAKRCDAEKMFLEVRPTNAPAIKLYEKFGFKNIGTRKNYYPKENGREDAIVLARDI